MDSGMGHLLHEGPMLEVDSNVALLDFVHGADEDGEEEAEEECDHAQGTPELLLQVAGLEDEVEIGLVNLYVS